LVEAYRDAQGRPRQRRLANLHGEPDGLQALARLNVQAEFVRDPHQLANNRHEQAVLMEHWGASRRELEAATREYKRILDDRIASYLARI
jgi:hypothetical protein